MTNLKALKDLYVSAGGALTDTYEDICNGLPVGNYTLLADVIEAISRVVGSGGELPYVVLTAGANSKVLLDGTALTEEELWNIVVLEGEKPVYIKQEARKYLYPLTYYDYLSGSEMFLEFGGAGLTHQYGIDGEPIIDVYKIYIYSHGTSDAKYIHVIREVANKTDGLPDPSGHADGSTLIIQSGKWVIQEGE